MNVKVDVGDLVACYGSSANLPADLTACGTAMDQSEEWCLLSWEDLTFQAETVVGEPTQCCNWHEDEAEACCDAREWQLTSTGVTNLENTIRQDCIDISFLMNEDSDITAVDCAGTTDLSEVDPETLDDCKDKEIDASGYVDAEYYLDIDPAHSFTTVDLGSESASTDLDGWAVVASGPKRVLVAVAWGDDFTAQGDAFTDNAVSVNAEILLSGSSNTYTVPLSQTFDIRLQGQRDSQEYAYALAPTVASGGTFDPGAGEWSYDYSETGSGTSITVHLEGTLTEVTP